MQLPKQVLRGPAAIQRLALSCFLLSGIGALAATSLAGETAGPSPEFVFATISDARAILGARDDYVRATRPLERTAKVKTADAVNEERFMRHMQDAALEWSVDQRNNLTPLLERLARFLDGIRWQTPRRILLIQSAAALEDDLPHTRANAVILPKTFYDRGPGNMAYVLSHETFHVLTRNNRELKETLYAAIGFKRCDTVIVPPAIAKQRITNPDAVESRHTISVRYRGETVTALPYIRFASENIDPRTGFIRNLQVAWLLVDRRGDECRARGGALAAGVPPEELEGLFEQVGRNTQYLFHPEEILADNFSRLFLVLGLGAPKDTTPSPEILEKMRKILFYH